MSLNNKDILYTLKEEYIENALPPKVAKLYSQFTRIKMKQPGLSSWSEQEFFNNLEDAITLIDAGIYEKEIDGDNWKELLVLGGEVLEWLSLPGMNISKKPLKILSAAAYQIAGYPAMALGILAQKAENDIVESEVLRLLLKADFQELMTYIIDFNELKTYKDSKTEVLSRMNQLIIEEIISCLGVVASYMRWGDEIRLDKAIAKFEAITKIMLDSKDSYSWLVAKLCSEVLKEYKKTSIRFHVESLSLDSSDNGKIAFERYIRNNHTTGKSLAWQSQILGINRLKENESFALCTPTGSGKTTIAEVAIIQNLFLNISSIEKQKESISPIVLYLVPSRALAAEVETKLFKVLNNISNSPITVTGLYGGTDWGPSDAWITSNEPTVLICTFEKGEALVRFLGPLFLERLSLVILDEAHSVQFNGNYETLVSSDNRNLRLEVLTNRLISGESKKKIIALSAVAGNGNQVLSDWITGELNSNTEVTSYRSTRQLVGRLEWSRNNSYKIMYDLMNGESLKFHDADDTNNGPFIQNPFDNPPFNFEELHKDFSEKGKVDKRQRPYLFWAALQLAKIDTQENQQSVLISVTQNISGYAQDFNWFFSVLLKEEFPQIFIYPTTPDKIAIWERCLLSCEDYFGKDSDEYKLLKRGVIVHHGNMPGLLARLLIEVINNKIIFLVLATSTLSEGVNLPFETVIIPTISRNGELIKIQEIRNLIGRAGRTGSGTEGRALIMRENGGDYSSSKSRENYSEIFKKLKNININNIDDLNPVESPLAEIFRFLVRKWVDLSGTNNKTEFFTWLEETDPLNDDMNFDLDSITVPLDTIDGILLASVVEYESKVNTRDITRRELEDYLKGIWRKTYAHYVSDGNLLLEETFYKRGGSLLENIYPKKSERNLIYRTNLSPRFAIPVIKKMPEIVEYLKIGTNYSIWSIEEKLLYIFKIVEEISELEKFEIPEKMGKGKNAPTWKEILIWWLAPDYAEKKPNNKQIARWIKFIKKNFEYKFNWGLGSVIALQMGEEYTTTSLLDWPKTELPWISFWLKELIIWGTVDPVVAHLLSHGFEKTRANAEIKAKSYYDLMEDEEVAEVLNASSIKKWSKLYEKKKAETNITNQAINVNLIRKFKEHIKVRVLPVCIGDTIYWMDTAGFKLAVCKMPKDWSHGLEKRTDFILNSKSSVIYLSPYI